MGERRAQIVGNAVAGALHFVHQTLDFRQHVIDQMREHVDFIAPANRQALAEIALGNALGDPPDRFQAAHLPHAQGEAAHHARHEAKNPAADQGVDDGLANPQDVREIARQHEGFAVIAALGHRAHHGRPLAAYQLQGVIERHATPVGRQIGRNT